MEQRIIESGEASVANASLVDMQKVSHFIVTALSSSNYLILCTSKSILGFEEIAEQYCLFLVSIRQ